MKRTTNLDPLLNTAPKVSRLKRDHAALLPRLLMIEQRGRANRHIRGAERGREREKIVLPVSYHPPSNLCRGQITTGTHVILGDGLTALVY
jgi:hypothetical protein